MTQTSNFRPGAGQVEAVYDFSGKTAVVTGGAGGIGRAISHGSRRLGPRFGSGISPHVTVRKECVSRLI